MEFKGFGKNSGPVVPPKSQAPFGDMPRPPYSPPHPFTPHVPDSSSKSLARAFDPPKRTHSPSSTFTINNPATGLSQVPATLNRPGSTLDSWGNQTKSTGDDNNLSNHGSRSPTEEADFRLQRSPNLSVITETVQKSSHLNQVISGK